MLSSSKVAVPASSKKLIKRLSPIIFWLQAVGFPLNVNFVTSRITRLIILGNCFLMLVIDVWIHADDLKSVFSQSPMPLNISQGQLSKNISNSTGPNFATPLTGTFTAVEIVNRTVLVCGVHFVFVWQSFTTWKRLWKVLIKIEHFYAILNTKLLTRTILIAFLVNLSELTLSSYAASQAGPIAQSTGTSYQKMLIILTFVTKFFPLSVGALFCAVTIVGTIFYESIRNDIEVNRKVVGKMIMAKWRKSLLLADQFVEEINRSFGLVLLIIFSFMFYDFISNCYNFVGKIRADSNTYAQNVYSSLELVVKIIELCCLVYIPTKMKIKATEVAISLRKLDMNDVDLRYEANISSLCLNILPPEITALGLFEINPQLIPTLVGTTVTYVIVMYQFESSST